MKPNLKQSLLALAMLPAAAFAQQPKLSVPGTPIDSRTLSTMNVPMALNGIGALSTDLLAYFAMDNVNSAGLTWSRKPISVFAQGAVKEAEGEGRKYLDFSAGGGVVRFVPALVPTPRFTYCAWVLMPPVGAEMASVWIGTVGDLLAFQKNAITCYDKRVKQTYYFAQADGNFSGWQHLAVTWDGRQMQGFFNGQPLATIPLLTIPALATMGNHRDTKYMNKFMCAGVDEVFMFQRVLSPAEITRVMAFGKPKVVAQPAAPNVPKPDPATPAPPSPPPVAPPKLITKPDPSKANFFGEMDEDR